MNATASELPPPVNHIFVDYENVHAIDPAVVGKKTVHFTLLVGARQTKIDISLAERLLQFAATVQLVRLQSSGKNALDFALAYYVGRAVESDPAGFFHIISKDTGYDPLIEHLRSKHIHACRHNDFSALSDSIPTKFRVAKPKFIAPPTAAKTKSPPKTKVQDPIKVVADDSEKRVLDHLRKPTATRPRTKTRLVSFLVAFLGHKITEDEALTLIEHIRQAGQLSIDDNDKVTYHLK